MTDKPEPPVTQEDRDAAMVCLELQTIRYRADGTFHNWDQTCQAFARHRIATEAKIRADQIERDAKLADGIAGNPADFERNYRRAAGQIAAAIRNQEPNPCL